MDPYSSRCSFPVQRSRYYVDSTEDATTPSRRRREKTGSSIHRIVYAQPSSVAGQSATATYRARPPQRRATNESEVVSKIFEFEKRIQNANTNYY